MIANKLLIVPVGIEIFHAENISRILMSFNRTSRNWNGNRLAITVVVDLNVPVGIEMGRIQRRNKKPLITSRNWNETGSYDDGEINFNVPVELKWFHQFHHNAKYQLNRTIGIEIWL